MGQFGLLAILVLLVCRRIADLLAERDNMHVIATEKAIERLALDREGVLSRLIAQYEKANAMDSPSAVGPAIKALELLGREIGMFIERHEMGAVGEFARMSDDELRALAGLVIEHSTPGNPADWFAAYRQQGAAPL